MDPKEIEVIDDRGAKAGMTNPFPGLRPFGLNESHLFFGRESQTKEIILRLNQNRFIGIIGSSGSGKSSLMNCGVFPALYDRRGAGAKAGWQIFTSRPGLNPIANLADALCSDGQDARDSASNISPEKDNITSILKSGVAGLSDVIQRKFQKAASNTLIFIDQFEEVFRLIERRDQPNAYKEVEEFIDLLIASSRQKETPVYIALSLRSDYIGETARFPELTNAINESHFLIPQMTRSQLQAAIEGPIAIGGGKISEPLLERILDDLGSSSDKLPLMQHALMRTWDFWVENKNADEFLDLKHYHAVGGIKEALSLHADEAYNDLTHKEKEICESMFKSLTEKGTETYGVRRPCSIEVISQIAGVSIDETINVAEKFREPGRSLIMPSVTTPLTSQTMIDISHESLMWIWNRLKVWVNEEAESAQMYIRLSEAAENYQVGRTGLWRPPDLQLALNWQQKQKPSLVWAQRYNPYFERAIVFLESSKKAYEDEQNMLALRHRRSLQKARFTSLVLGLAAVISIIFFVFAILKKIDADNQAQIASQKALESEANFQLAEKRLVEVERQRIEAETAREDATRNALESERNFHKASSYAERAEINLEIAEEQAALAERQAALAIQNETEAQRQKSLAEMNEQKAWRLRILSIAQSMAVKSLQERDDDLKALLAIQAYYFNRENAGDPYDAYIYDGLYYALRQLEDDSLFYRIKAHKDAVRSLAFSESLQDKRFFSAGSDGAIMQWDLDRQLKLVYLNKATGRTLEISDDGRLMVNAGHWPYFQVFDLESPVMEPAIIKSSGIVYDVKWIPDSQSFISTGLDSALYLHGLSDSRILTKINSQIKCLAIKPDGALIAGGTSSGEVYIWNTEDYTYPVVLPVESPVHSISFNYRGDLMAFGDEDGNVSLFPCEGNDINFQDKFILSGHQARISSVRFSPDDLFLASAGFDGRVQLWNVNNLDKLPVILRDGQSFIWSLTFSHDSQYLASGNGDGTIKIWPTNMEELAIQLGAKLNRNMTEKEWKRYVAPDIPYRPSQNEGSEVKNR